MSLESKLSRRAFISGSAAATLSVAAGFRWEDKLILGSGDFRYECIHDWIVPPEGMVFGDTHGVAQDSKGRIFVAHTVNAESKIDDAICVYDEKGKFLNSWGSRFKGGAHGLDLRREGSDEYLYHCDTAHRLVVKTKLDGTVVWEKGAPKESGKYNSGEAFIPTNVAFAPDGDFYVADGYGSNWIHQYDVKGNFIRTFGGSGSEPGQVSQPHGLWVDTRKSEPLLAVADRANRRIQYFSLDGKHVSFTSDGMRLPCHFSLRNELMLVPDLESVVTILDADNKPVAQLGDGKPTNLRGKARSEFLPGKFIHPHDSMFLRNGDILVAEWVPQGRVTLLKKVK
jgi:DNA-binding beta-propeller fold protein YncE